MSTTLLGKYPVGSATTQIWGEPYPDPTSGMIRPVEARATICVKKKSNKVEDISWAWDWGDPRER